MVFSFPHFPCPRPVVFIQSRQLSLAPPQVTCGVPQARRSWALAPRGLGGIGNRSPRSPALFCLPAPPSEGLAVLVPSCPWFWGTHLIFLLPSTATQVSWLGSAPPTVLRLRLTGVCCLWVWVFLSTCSTCFMWGPGNCRAAALLSSYFSLLMLSLSNP